MIMLWYEHVYAYASGLVYDGMLLTTLVYSLIVKFQE